MIDERAEAGITPVRNDNGEMAEAILKAKRTIPQFLEAFGDPKPNQAGFHFKVRFEVENQIEHIWLTNLELEKQPPTGTVANDAGLPGIEFGQRVAFERAWVTDWMYTQDDAIVGGFTTRVLVEMRKRQASGGMLEMLRKKLRRQLVH